MTEPNPLEFELLKMRPRPLDAQLLERIDSAVADIRPWADRLLLCAIGAGSLAACVIAVMLTLSSRASLPQIPPAQAAAHLPTIGNYSQALAHADDDWIIASK